MASVKLEPIAGVWGQQRRPGVEPLVRGTDSCLAIGRPKSAHNYLLLCNRETFKNSPKSDKNRINILQLFFHFHGAHLTNKYFMYHRRRPPLLPPFPFPPFRSKSLKYIWGSGEHCKLPSGVWGETPVDKRFSAYLSRKVQLW